jgi:SNF2 family DNA or RNA helicase
MKRSDLYPYQEKAIQHILDRPNAMLWEDVGLGKTAQALTAICELQDRLLIPAALVIAPKRIIQAVWRQEAVKWEHTRHLRFSLVHGSAARRLAALRRRADIYLVNYENLPWLATQIKHLWLRKGHYPPFQMVIYDEVTKLKNSQSKRAKAWGKILPYFSRRVGLTGEPAANGYKDLFGQFFAVDAGQRLGTSLTAYREAFLKPLGYNQFGWAVTKAGQEQIHRRISDITLELSAKDYLDLPPVVNNLVWVELPLKARAIYDKLEREFFAELDSGAELEAVNEASKLNKLLQICGGAAYLADGHHWEEIHREKIHALVDLVDEAGGRPQLLGYAYVHEAKRIAQAFPEDPQRHEGATFLSSQLGERGLSDVLRRWEHDEIPLLCGHPASMGHGLNLQGASACSVIWFSLPWSLELYKQMNGRLFGGHRRQGTSVVHHILARGTVDEVVWAALLTNSATQAGLKKAVSEYRRRKNL